MIAWIFILKSIPVLWADACIKNSCRNCILRSNNSKFIFVVINNLHFFNLGFPLSNITVSHLLQNSHLSLRVYLPEVPVPIKRNRLNWIQPNRLFISYKIMKYFELWTLNYVNNFENWKCTNEICFDPMLTQWERACRFCPWWKSTLFLSVKVTWFLFTSCLILVTVCRLKPHYRLQISLQFNVTWPRRIQ